MLRASLGLGFAVICGCGSTEHPTSSPGSAGSSAGTVGTAAGATQGGSAAAANTGGAVSGGGVAGSVNGGSSGGAAASAGGTGEGGADNGACNTLVNSAPVVNEVVIKGDPPAPLGGTITDGTYYETSYIVYTQSSSQTPSATEHQLTAHISGSTFQAVFLDETNTEQRITLELLPNGTMLREHQTCRTNSKLMMNDLNVLGYDATPIALTIHLLQDSLTGDYTVYTLTKQG